MQAKVVQAGASKRISLEGIEIRVRGDSADTDGALSVLEEIVAPSMGSPLHTTRQQKILVVVDGELDLVLADCERRIRAGDTAFIPGGVPHRFFNPTAESARLLMLIMPGGHEEFLSELSTLAAEGQMTPQAAGSLCERHGVEILG